MFKHAEDLQKCEPGGAPVRLRFSESKDERCMGEGTQVRIRHAALNDLAVGGWMEINAASL